MIWIMLLVNYFMLIEYNDTANNAKNSAGDGSNNCANDSSDDSNSMLGGKGDDVINSNVDNNKVWGQDSNDTMVTTSLVVAKMMMLYIVALVTMTIISSGKQHLDNNNDM